MTHRVWAGIRTNVFDVSVSPEVIVGCPMVGAVQSVDGPLRLPQLRQIMDLRLLPSSFEGRGHNRGRTGAVFPRTGRIVPSPSGSGSHGNLLTRGGEVTLHCHGDIGSDVVRYVAGILIVSSNNILFSPFLAGRWYDVAGRGRGGVQGGVVIGERFSHRVMR
jgi:hypothetical protein